VAAERFVQMIEASFSYFASLGKWHQDPAGVDAVQMIRDRMVRDLKGLLGEPSPTELAKLCREWRGLRIEVEGPASYPPDMFIESVCQVIELS
jgi:hypothetical protein